MKFLCSISTRFIVIGAIIVGCLCPSVNSAGVVADHVNRSTEAILFHYTSQLVTLSNLTRVEKSNIILLADEPLLARKNLSLLRCSLYRFNFKFHDRNQLISETRIIQTPKEEPQSKIGITSPSGNSIELVWTSNYPECVDYYVIRIRDLGESRYTSIKIPNGSSYELTGLIPCTNYQILLDTYSNGQRKDQSMVTERTTLANIQQSKFQHTSIGNSSVRFTWTKLRDVDRCDGDYFVKMIPADDLYSVVFEKHVPYSENELILTGFGACRKYNVSLNANYFDIVAVLEDFSSPFASPSNIYGCSFDKDELVLEWQMATENVNCVSHYTVSVLDVQIETKSTTLKMNNLERCQTHNISVFQVDTQGNQYPPLRLEVALDLGVLSDDIDWAANITYTYDETTDQMMLTWNKPIGYENCNLTYSINSAQYQEEEITEESVSIPWDDKEVYVEISINHEFGRSFPIGLTIRTPVPVTNIQHVHLEDGRTKIFWSKPESELDIENYIVIWENKEIPVPDTFLIETFPRCILNEVVVYVKYTNHVSANASYSFSNIVVPDALIIEHKFRNPDYVISWNLPNEKMFCYTSFIIVDSINQLLFVVNGFEFVFSSWLDDMEYSFEITAMFDNDHKSKHVKHIIKTPGAVKHFRVTENVGDTATFEWDRPEDNPDHTPVEYVLTVQGENHSTTLTNINLLVPFCVDLEIVLTVRYDSGIARALSITKRLLKIPGPVQNLLIGIENEIIHVRWDGPEESQSCVNAYRVQVNGESVIVAEPQHDIKIWESCAVLTVKVSAQNMAGEAGTEMTKEIQTPEGSISEVTNLNIITTEKTLRINWDEPLNSPKCVTAYHVSVWDTKSLESIYDLEKEEQMFLFLEELKACQEVSVQIVPVGQRPSIGQLIRKDTVMKNRAPGPLTPLKSLEIKSRALKLQTTFQDHNYMCPFELITLTCRNQVDAVKTVQTKLDSMIPVTEEIFELYIDELDPYEQYTCHTILQNVFNEWSNPSFETTFQTLEDLSGPPIGVHISSRSHDFLKWDWTEPVKPNGRITHYAIRVKEIMAQYYLPEYCRQSDKTLSIDTTSVQKQYRVDNLNPYTTYELSISGINGAGAGEDYTLIGQTQSYVPDPPQELQIISLLGPSEALAYNGSAKIRWKFPCLMHGPFEYFHGVLLEFNSDVTEYAKETFIERSVGDDYEIEFVNLLPSHNYQLKMISVTSEINSTIASLHFRAPAAMPQFIPINEMIWNMDINPNQGAVLKVLMRDLQISGELLYYAIMISEMDCQPDPKPQRKVMNTRIDWPGAISWYNVQNDVCQRQYQATPARFSLGLNNNVKNENREPENSEYLEIRVGGDDCLITEDQYCNGPLKAGAKYAVVLRLFTETGFTDNPHIVLETLSEIRLAVVIVMVIAVLLCGFLAGIIIVRRNKSKGAVKDPMQVIMNQKSKQAPDIPTKNFAHHFDVLRKNNCEQLNTEFQTINSGGSVATYDVAKSNLNKNRYTNIFPYDFNRVVLEKSTESNGETDYINASFINGFSRPQEYIASQGPKMNSSIDFWRMILQYKVSTIVMLTSYREGPKDKCHEYFPSTGSEILQFDDINVKCKELLDFPTHKKRIFSVEKKEILQTVYHYHFVKWPDHSCPYDPKELIEFTRTVRSERKHPSHPLVVHCSAGVGRTGTFLALDIAMQQMRSKKKVNVSNIVKDLRRQRMKMVQSYSQYLLIYQCINLIMTEMQATSQQPIWKRFSGKPNLNSENENKKLSQLGLVGTHNFGMLQLDLKTRRISNQAEDVPPPDFTSAADLLGNGRNLTSICGNAIDLCPIPEMDSDNCKNGAGFEPDDSIS